MFLFHIAKIMELYDNGIILCLCRMFFLYCNELPIMGLDRFLLSIFIIFVLLPHINQTTTA